jgi:hypothetical protein
MFEVMGKGWVGLTILGLGVLYFNGEPTGQDAVLRIGGCMLLLAGILAGTPKDETRQKPPTWSLMS